MATTGPNGSPQLTWFNVVATLALLATIAGGAWILFQSQFHNLEDQMRAQDASNATLVKELRIDLDRLRDASVLRAEHIEFVKRLDEHLSGLQKRLDVIEATRPTTGELQSQENALKSDINALRDSMKFLERAPRPQSTEIPPH